MVVFIMNINIETLVHDNNIFRISVFYRLLYFVHASHLLYPHYLFLFHDFLRYPIRYVSINLCILPIIYSSERLSLMYREEFK